MRRGQDADLELGVEEDEVGGGSGHRLGDLLTGDRAPMELPSSTEPGDEGQGRGRWWGRIGVDGGAEAAVVAQGDDRLAVGGQPLGHVDAGHEHHPVVGRPQAPGQLPVGVEQARPPVGGDDDGGHVSLARRASRRLGRPADVGRRGRSRGGDGLVDRSVVDQAPVEQVEDPIGLVEVGVVVGDDEHEFARRRSSGSRVW